MSLHILLKCLQNHVFIRDQVPLLSTYRSCSYVGNSRLNIMCAQHVSRRDLKALIDTALTTFTGRLFQALTTRMENNLELSSSGGTFLFRQFIAVLVVVFSTPQAEPRSYSTIQACIYIPRSCPLSFDDMQVPGELISLVGWHNHPSSSQGNIFVALLCTVNCTRVQVQGCSNSCASSFNILGM